MFKTIRTFFSQTLAPVTLTGIAARAGAWVDENYTCVETSRYTHATRGQHRVWFSKPAAGGNSASGAVVTEEGGLITITLTDWKGRAAGKPEVLTPEVAQAVGAMLRSAAVRAKPSTGRRMDRSRWTPARDQARDVAGVARFEAGLFDGI
jgi:hypothetical protein